MDRNPCLSCDLRDEDKNSRRCTDCDKRVQYVSGLVGRMPAGTIKDERPTSNTQHRMVNKKETGTALHSHGKSREGEQMTEIEILMHKICGEERVNFSELQQGKFHGKYTKARLRIAKELVSRHHMTCAAVGELTGVSDAAISGLLFRDKKKAARKKEGKTAEGEHRTSNVHHRMSNEKKENGRTVTVDFSEHTETLKQLEEYAKAEIRSVEDQVLYFIIKSLPLAAEE